MRSGELKHQEWTGFLTETCCLGICRWGVWAEHVVAVCLGYPFVWEACFICGGGAGLIHESGIFFSPLSIFSFS